MGMDSLGGQLQGQRGGVGEKGTSHGVQHRDSTQLPGKWPCAFALWSAKALSC